MQLRRQLVIGDIHGALKALLQVLERSQYDPKQDQLIFLGDYVDGWPESAQVVQKIIELIEQAEFTPICLLGNHDEWCKEWLFSGVAPEIWLLNGGQETIRSYVNSLLLTEENHRRFFRALVPYYQCPEFGAVHGGYRSYLGLGHEDIDSTYCWDRKLWNIALSGRHGELPHRLRPHPELFIGHTSTTNWDTTNPMNACNVWNVDTGAGWDGVLTAMDVKSKEYWQSDVVQTLYPTHRGRN